MGCGLPTCYTSENGSDGHAEASQIALTQNGPGHDFTCGKKVAHWPLRRVDLRPVRDLEAQIGECDPVLS